MTTFTLTLPDDKAARLRARAEANGEDPNAFAVAAVLRALDAEDDGDDPDAALTEQGNASPAPDLADSAAGRGVKPAANVPTLDVLLAGLTGTIHSKKGHWIGERKD